MNNSSDDSKYGNSNSNINAASSGNRTSNFSASNSLVVLLCGKPGTGKTMTVNAVAHHLGKKVLLVDFGALVGLMTPHNFATSELKIR